MEQLDLPGDEVWSERRFWFEDLESEAGRSGAPSPSEQACALMIDLQAVYCAGAFSAVVILASAIVEAQGGADPVTPELRRARRWLQDLRNRLVHEDREQPVITVEDHWLRRNEWQAVARRAILLAFGAFYPGADFLAREDSGQDPA
jgi:hypothetical protein